MTQPPSVPQPPSAPSVPTGLDDLDETPEVWVERPDDDPFNGEDHSDEPLSSDDLHDPETGDWADESQASVADPDYLAQLDPPADPASQNPFDSLPPAPPEEDEEKKKPSRTKAHKPEFIDWSQVTPRKEDDFASSFGSVSPVTQKIRDFLNEARQQGWYGLYYPVVAYKNRNSAQSITTKINTWRNNKSNRYGIRDGEDVSAKCEAQDSERYVIWIALVEAPGVAADYRTIPDEPTAPTQ